MSSPLLRIDMSSLSAFSMCKRRGIMSGVHHLQLETEAIPLKAGKAIHLGIETKYKGGSDEECLRVFDEDYRDFSDRVVYEDNPRNWENLRQIFQIWLKRFPNHPYAIPNPDFVEIGFSLELTPWLTIVGKPDALVKYNGSWWVLDTKTTGKFDHKFRDKWNHSGQISCYIYALGQHLKAIGDPTPVVGAIINAIEIKDIPKSGGVCRSTPKHLHPNGEAMKFSECGPEHITTELILANRTPSQLEDWKNGVINEAWEFLKAKTKWPNLSDIPNVPANGIMNDACGLCKYRQWCFGGKDPRMLNVMFTEDKWEPFPGALYV